LGAQVIEEADDAPQEGRACDEPGGPGKAPGGPEDPGPTEDQKKGDKAAHRGRTGFLPMGGGAFGPDVLAGPKPTGQPRTGPSGKRHKEGPKEQPQF
jgi:hypothetical protein